MTYIEYYVNDAIENICACLAQIPDRVILIGDNNKRLERKKALYKKIFESRGHTIDFDCISVNKYNLSDIITKLTALIEKYDDCEFGLTGGEELYFVALGILFERYPQKKLQMHRFNIRNGTIYDCDNDGQVISVADRSSVALTVEENIEIYGGSISSDPGISTPVNNWNWDDELADDICTMWDICRADPREWNIQVGLIAAGVELQREPSTHSESLSLSIPLSRLSELLDAIHIQALQDMKILRKLRGKGLLTAFSISKSELNLTFKNSQIKYCLSKAGQVLELMVYLSAITAQENDETYTYFDVMNGVQIDWDNLDHGEQGNTDTVNEIDVLMMHSMVPIFVSCKNGRIEIDELYKLNTVARKFGGQYAKMILIASSLDIESTYGQTLKQRADDMGIVVIHNMQTFDYDAMKAEIRTIHKRVK